MFLQGSDKAWNLKSKYWHKTYDQRSQGLNPWPVETTSWRTVLPQTLGINCTRHLLISGPTADLPPLYLYSNGQCTSTNERAIEIFRTLFDATNMIRLLLGDQLLQILWVQECAIFNKVIYREHQYFVYNLDHLIKGKIITSVNQLSNKGDPCPS